MIWLISLLAIGLVVGWLTSSFTEGRGLGPLGSVIVGVVGSFLGGLLAVPLSMRLFGEGPEYMVSLIVAAVMAVVLILIVSFIKR